MLQFDEAFFEGETRSDFYIEPMMKRAWAVELEVFTQVVEICKRYGIPYFAAYGTFLGAVRHQGFIPWDDDIDIAVKRSDYQRLLQLLAKELPQGYVVESYYTAQDHHQPWTSIMNTKYVLTDEEQIKRFYGCPYIAGIDIYPIDFIQDDPAEDDIQMKLYGAVLNVAQCYPEYEESGELYEYIGQIEQMCGVSLSDDGTLRQQLFVLADQLCAMYPEEESSYCTIMSSRLLRGDRDFKFPKEWYEHAVELPFEQVKMAVPADYEAAIQIYYGENYMTPRRFAQSHEYPFYKRQEEFLNERGIYTK